MVILTLLCKSKLRILFYVNTFLNDYISFTIVALASLRIFSSAMLPAAINLSSSYCLNALSFSLLVLHARGLALDLLTT